MQNLETVSSTKPCVTLNSYHPVYWLFTLLGLPLLRKKRQNKRDWHFKKSLEVFKRQLVHPHRAPKLSISIPQPSDSWLG